MDLEDDAFLEECYSNELRQAMRIAASKKLEEHPDFYELDEEPNCYDEGVPFKIEVPDRVSVIKQLATSAEQSVNHKEESRCYFNDSFCSASPSHSNPALKQDQPSGKQTLQQLSSIQHERSECFPTAVLRMEAEDHQQLPNQSEAKATKSQRQPQGTSKQSQQRRITPAKSPKAARRPYTKAPFHGLFYKRHIRSPNGHSPSSDSEERLRTKPKYASVSKLFVKQIVDMEDSAIEALDEHSIAKLNDVLAERLAKYRDHYKEQVKEKFYIEANELMRRVLVNRKTIERQRMRIGQIEDKLRRQSVAYSQSLQASITDLQKKKKMLIHEVKQLQVNVHMKDGTEKKVEKREQLQQQITQMRWQCILLGKHNSSKHARESLATKKIQSVTNALQKADARIRDLEATMLCIVEKYYELHPKKDQPSMPLPTAARVESVASLKSSTVSKPLLQTPSKKTTLVSHRRHSTQSFQPHTVLSPAVARQRYNSSCKLARRIFSNGTKVYRIHHPIDRKASEIQLTAKKPNDLRFRSVPRERLEQIVQNFSVTEPLENISRVQTEVQTDFEYEPPTQISNLLPHQQPSAPPVQQIFPSEGQSEPEKPVISQIVQEHIDGALSKPFLYIRNKSKQEVENPEITPPETMETVIAPANNITPKMMFLSRRRLRHSTQSNDASVGPMLSLSAQQKSTSQPRPSPQRPRHRIRNFAATEIESIAQVDEPDQLHSIHQTKEVIIKKFESTSVANLQPAQLKRHRRKFELRSGTESDEISDLEEIPLLRQELTRPSWLEADQPSLL